METGKLGNSDIWYKMHFEGKQLDYFVHKDKLLFTFAIEVWFLSLFCCQCTSGKTQYSTLYDLTKAIPLSVWIP